jgi:pyridoxal phosphate enzyme (YggS family)
MTIKDSIETIKKSAGEAVTLVAVSKTHPAELVRQAYDAGQRHFGENKVQELVAKAGQLPDDIHWHLIGHLQTNKVKFVVPFIYLIHSVDSEKLLKTIDKEAGKAGTVVRCLLQIHIADEETKFGFAEKELFDFMASGRHRDLKNVHLCGVMGMATFTDDQQIVRAEFKKLHSIFTNIKQRWFAGDSQFSVISMGMSDDYEIAVQEGSTMIRVGSKIFGSRSYDKP